MARPRVARRRIPVADAASVQLPLALRWEQPIDAVLVSSRDPEPAAPVLLVVSRKRAA